jgi:hypothetical protein
MQFGFSKSKRKRKWLYVLCAFGLIAVLVLVIISKSNRTPGKVTLTFVGFTNEPAQLINAPVVHNIVPNSADFVTVESLRYEISVTEAVVLVRNGTFDPIEIQQGIIMTNSPVLLHTSLAGFLLVTSLGAPIVLKPGESKMVHVTLFPRLPVWWTEIQYQRRSFWDRQFVRLWNSGKPPLRFVTRISSSWSHIVTVESGWITNQPPENVLLRSYVGDSEAKLVEVSFDGSSQSAPPLASSPQVPEPSEPPPATGPIADATDATQRAVRAANDVAQKKGFRRPFRTSAKSAVLEGGQWMWRGLVGNGRGDIEAAVRLNADGTLDDALVWLINSMPAPAGIR